MSLKIIILSTNSQPDGSFSVSGVFWLDAPSNNIIPLPKFDSQVPFIDPQNLLSLQSGVIVEQSFNSGLFVSGTILADVQTALQSQFDTAQTALNNTNSPLNGLIGNVFDGNAWSTTNPFASFVGLDISDQYTQRFYTWTKWKAMYAIKGGKFQFDDNGAIYTIWLYDGPEIHICIIWKGSVPLSQIQAGYTQNQNDTDKADFEGKYKAHGNGQLQIKTSDGRVLNAVGKGDISKANFYTHDWSDPTTWYEKSIRVVDEVATDDGYHTTYSVTYVNMIDLYHGKITQEDYMKTSDGYSYRVVVKVNDVVKAEQNPHYMGTGGDFTVDYVLGKVTFLSTRDPADVIKVTYCYATNSTFTVKPATGKMLRVDVAEVQFANDVQVTDTIVFQPYGLVDFFAPQLMPGVPSGTKIPLGNPVVYKSMTDYQAEAMRAYPLYPPIGGNTWRGCPYSILVMNWDYISSTVLKSSMGMEVRLKLEHDQPFTGYYATATFYCNSSDE